MEVKSSSDQAPQKSLAKTPSSPSLSCSNRVCRRLLCLGALGVLDKAVPLRAPDDKESGSSFNKRGHRPRRSPYVGRRCAAWEAERTPLQAPAGSEDYDHTDSGKVDRLMDHYQDDLRYVTSWNKWLIWDGHRFRRDVRAAPQCPSA